ncbi:MFS transporter [Pseudomonas laurylsulfativorans]|nr:MFS transporter [Pseudomonas laurylsulfativorans]
MDQSAAKSVTSAVLTLMAAVAVVGSNGLLLSPILGEVSNALNASVESVAKVMAAYGGGTALSALVLAPLIDRIGARRSLLIGLSVLLVALLASSMAMHVIMLGAAQVLAGFGAGLVLPSAYALATKITSPQQASQALGRVLIGWSLSMVVVVPIAAYIAENFSWRFAYLMLAVGLVMVLPRIYYLPRDLDNAVSNNQPKGVTVALRYPGVVPMLSISFVFSTAFYGVYAFLMQEAQSTLHIPTGESGLLVLAYGFGFAITTVAGKVIGRLGPKKLLPMALIANAMLFALLLPAMHNFVVLFVVVVTWGIVEHLCLGSMVLLLSQVRPDRRGTVLGLNSAITYVGFMFGTAVASDLYPKTGFISLVIAAVGLHIVATVIFMFRRQHIDKTIRSWDTTSNIPRTIGNKIIS